MRLYLFFGPPGSGKGTQAKLITQEFENVFYLSTGDILRKHIKEQTDIGKKANEYISQGLLVPSALINQIVINELNKEKERDFILDGYPRTVDQLYFLIENKVIPFLTIFFDVPLNVLIERICFRRVCPNCNSIFHLIYQKPQNDEKCDYCGSKLIQRNDDNEEIVRKRYDVYTKETLPVIEEIRKQGIRIENIDATKNIEEIYREVRKFFL